MATTAAEVEQRARLPPAVGFEQAAVEGGRLGLVADRRQKGIPVRQVAVEPETLVGTFTFVLRPCFDAMLLTLRTIPPCRPSCCQT